MKNYFDSKKSKKHNAKYRDNADHRNMFFEKKPCTGNNNCTLKSRHNFLYITPNIYKKRPIVKKAYKTSPKNTTITNEFFNNFEISSHAKNYLVIKNTENKLHRAVQKHRITAYDLLLCYYKLQVPSSLYCQKVFILLEMQLNALLAKTKLIPYLFMAEDLCFYRLVFVNDVIVSSPYYITGLYDSIRIPIHLYNYIYYRQYRLQRYPKAIANFFNSYWQYITGFPYNKTWLLNNYLTSRVSAETFIFDYPNLLLYSAPFIRFTKLFYKNKANVSYDDTFFTYSHVALKLQLFNYVSFYK